MSHEECETVRNAKISWVSNVNLFFFRLKRSADTHRYTVFSANTQRHKAFLLIHTIHKKIILLIHAEERSDLHLAQQRGHNDLLSHVLRAPRC